LKIAIYELKQYMYKCGVRHNRAFEAHRLRELQLIFLWEVVTLR